ncbi:MAG: HAD-IA family hydrolase [Phycisphaerales bacterium JB041]
MAETMAGSQVRMVCFDAGGVLVRICRTWRERCERAGLPFRWSSEAEADSDERRAIHAEFERGRMPPDAYFAALAESAGGLYTAEELHAIHVAWIAEEYPGARALVQALRDVPTVSTGLLSNTNAVHWATPSMTGDTGSAVSGLDHPHASHLLGLTKPTTEIFRAFERESGFDAGSILFFDDLPENVEAARAAGWSAERIDHTGDTTAQVVTHLAARGVRLTPAT